MKRTKDAAARAVRDERIVELYLAGHSYRAIAAQPDVGLSPPGVLKVVRGHLAAGVDPVVVSAAFGAVTRRRVRVTSWQCARCAASGRFSTLVKVVPRATKLSRRNVPEGRHAPRR